MPADLDDLFAKAVKDLAKLGLSICTAESCSAGALATALAQANKADVFVGGIVAYTKEAKVRLLDVSSDLIKEQTAVSASVAEAMALGAVVRSGAAIGVAITGVAGPDEDEDGNPVGLIYCAVARSDGTTRHVRLDLTDTDPDRNVHAACRAAVKLVVQFVKEEEANLVPCP